MISDSVLIPEETIMEDNGMHELMSRALLGGRRSNMEGGPVADGTSAPAVRIVNLILHEAMERHASDIHIEPGINRLRIRLRVDGVLEPSEIEPPQDLSERLTSRIKVMAGLKTTERNLPQDGRFTWDGAGHPTDVRVSTMPVMEGESLVLRLLTGAQELRRIEELGFSSEKEERFRSWCLHPYGLLLNVGPVNSGKTTTLYAALEFLNHPERNIVTIEDPVECSIQGINQMQINPRTNLTFAAGLRALLRQDPDVCMVGEIRDEETAEAAVRAALSGRLLFSTLHTDSAVGAVFRLLDMGIPPYLLAAALLGIVAQRLVRRLCPKCRTEYEVGEGTREAALLGRHYHKGIRLWKADGCEACRHTGYQGRIAVQELLSVTTEIRQAIIERRDREGLKRLVQNGGMVTLNDDAVAKALAGETSVEEIGRVIHGLF